MSTACANAYVQPMMLLSGATESGLGNWIGLAFADVERRNYHSGNRIPTTDLSRRKWSGGRCNPGAEHRGAERSRKGLILRHGRYHRQDHANRRCEPLLSRAFEVARAYRFLKGSGLPLRIPVIEMVEIGAGGGSVASLDALRQIAVGPESAGSDPGPACYGRGNEAATVTDADVVMGRIDPAGFAGGKIALFPERAVAAIKAEIADTLEISNDVAAAGVDEIVNENMANAARVHAIEHGKDTADRTLVAFGGAAPLHAARLADKLGLDRVIIPRGAGVGSAVGFLMAPIAYEVVRTRLVDLREFDAEYVNGIFEDMRREAEAVVRLGAPDAKLVETRTAYMRYRGQGHEITVSLPTRPFALDDAALLQKLFDTAYAAHFTRTIPNLNVEALTWNLTLATERPLPAAVPAADTSPVSPSEESRTLFDPVSGDTVEAPLYQRDDPLKGLDEGPAVVAEDETSIVPPNYWARLNALAEIELLRKES